MRQKLEQWTAGRGSGGDEAIIEHNLGRLRPEGYSDDEDVKTVFDRFRRAIAARHELAILTMRKRWGET